MPESKKIVIKVDVHDDKDKRKAMKAVSSLSGIESLAIDMKHKKLTLIGDIDPVDVVGKLKKWYTEIVAVGPAKEEKKKEEPKKDETKDEDKKNEEKRRCGCYDARGRWMDLYRQQPPGNKTDEKDEEQKRLAELEAMRRWMDLHRPINPYMPEQYRGVHSVEDYPNNGCVIC